MDQNDDKFLKLIGENRAKLLKICRVYAWGRADQEDLYQEMLFQIWRALPGLRGEAYANTWLYRVALNTAISHVRKQKRERGQVVSGCDPTVHEIPDGRGPGEGNAEEKFTQLEQAIARLNETEKAVITLFLEELTYEQMASVLGVTENHVGVMLHRAKKKLSTLMKEAPCATTN